MISYFNFKFDAPMGYDKLFPFLIISYYSFVIFILSFCWVKIIQPAEGYMNPYFITTPPLILTHRIFIWFSAIHSFGKTDCDSLLSVCVFFFKVCDSSLFFFFASSERKKTKKGYSCFFLYWFVVFYYGLG
jgi:hypothetical protein